MPASRGGFKQQLPVVMKGESISKRATRQRHGEVTHAEKTVEGVKERKEERGQKEKENRFLGAQGF